MAKAEVFHEAMFEAGPKKIRWSRILSQLPDKPVMAKLQRFGNYSPYIFIPIDEVEDVVKSLLFLLEYHERNVEPVEMSDIVLTLEPDERVILAEEPVDVEPTEAIAGTPCNNCTKHERGCTSDLKDTPGLTSCPDQYPRRSAHNQERYERDGYC